MVERSSALFFCMKELKMPFSLNLPELYDWIEERWQRRSTIVFVLILVGVLLSIFFADVDLTILSVGSWIIISVSLLTIWLIWLLPRRVPTTKRKKIGILVGISAENRYEEERLRADFIMSLKEFIGQTSQLHQFQLIELNSFHSKRIDDETSAYYYLHKSKAKFVLYGRIRTRPLGEGKPSHILDLRGLVSHKPIPQELSERISTDFGGMLPPRVVIHQEAGVFAFEVTAKIVDLVARYIISLSSLVSGEVRYATELLEDIKTRMSVWPQNLPATQKIIALLPHRLGECYHQLAWQCYNNWYTSRESEYLVQLEAFLPKLFLYQPNNYHGIISKAICAFVLRRDIKEALIAVRKCKGMDDSLWKYSEAFLLAYQNKVPEAKQAYWKAFKMKDSSSNIQVQVEEFLDEVISQEPDKYRLHYFSGLINFHKKEDKASALRDFQLFLNKDSDGHYPALITDTKKYVEQISKQLSESQEDRE